MKKLINLTDKVQDQIDFIIEKEGHKTFTAAIHFLIINHYNKTYFDKRGRKIAGLNDPAVKKEELTNKQKCEGIGGKVSMINGIECCTQPMGKDGAMTRTFPLD